MAKDSGMMAKSEVLFSNGVSLASFYVAQNVAGCSTLGSSCVLTYLAQWGVMVWTINSNDVYHVTVLGRLFTQRCGAWANSAFYPFGVSKWGPAWAGKVKGMIHTICR